MGKEQDYQYHVERARTEMDSAYRARSDAAAASHMRLSALHMDRARLVKASLAASFHLQLGSVSGAPNAA